MNTKPTDTKDQVANQKDADKALVLKYINASKAGELLVRVNVASIIYRTESGDTRFLQARQDSNGNVIPTFHKITADHVNNPEFPPDLLNAMAEFIREEERSGGDPSKARHNQVSDLRGHKVRPLEVGSAEFFANLMMEDKIAQDSSVPLGIV